jgi:hypothetical protein
MGRWLAALCLLGCSAKFPTVVVPGDEYQLVASLDDTLGTAAAADWNSMVPELRISMVEVQPVPCAHCILEQDVTSKTSDSVCFGAPADLGCTYRLPYLSDASVMMVATDVTHDERAWSWKHELGHAMGLYHAGMGTLMFPEYAGAAHNVTAADVAQYRMVRGR